MRSGWRYVQLLYKGGGNRFFPHLYKFVTVLLGFYAITRNSTVDTSTVKNWALLNRGMNQVKIGIDRYFR